MTEIVGDNNPTLLTGSAFGDGDKLTDLQVRFNGVISFTVGDFIL